MRTFIKLLLALSLTLAGVVVVEAQTSPGLVQGQVPTAAQWNSYFAAKQDTLNGTPLSTLGGTMLGPLLLSPSVSAAAGVNVAPGAVPSAPNNGDLWVTAAGIFARVNGVTVNLTTASSGLATSGGTMTGELLIAASSTPSAGINFQIGVAPSAPANGDFWVTTADAFVRVGGATVNLTTIPAARLPAFGSADVSFAAGGGAGTIAANAVTNGKLALATAQNTVKGAATSTAEADLSMPSCSSASNGLIWTTNTGFGCNTFSAGGTGLVSIVTYSGTQTITIPTGATKGFVRMWGGTGGSGGTGASAAGSATGGTGAAGYLEKYLTGLTPGNTLAYTQGGAGAGGSSAPTSGGTGTASTLASGTQTITTLTANGSGGSASANGTSSGGSAGGGASNGDLNISGAPGSGGFVTAAGDALAGVPGVIAYSVGAAGIAGTSAAGNGGRSGGLVVTWFQ